jgi:hypothetical protein
MGVSDLLAAFHRLEQFIISKEGSKYVNLMSDFKSLWSLISQVKNIYLDINSYSLSSFLTTNVIASEVTSGADSYKGFLRCLKRWL